MSWEELVELVARALAGGQMSAANADSMWTVFERSAMDVMDALISAGVVREPTVEHFDLGSVTSSRWTAPSVTDAVLDLLAEAGVPIPPQKHRDDPTPPDRNEQQS